MRRCGRHHCSGGSRARVLQPVEAPLLIRGHDAKHVLDAVKRSQSQHVVVDLPMHHCALHDRAARLLDLAHADRHTALVHHHPYVRPQLEDGQLVVALEQVAQPGSGDGVLQHGLHKLLHIHLRRPRLQIPTVVRSPNVRRLPRLQLQPGVHAELLLLQLRGKVLVVF